MGNPERAIVTTGGTREQIDDVRYITNFATGKFGHTIAEKLAKKGYSVTLLCPKEVPILAGGKIEGVEYTDFTDTESLRGALLRQDGPVVIFHAAAVSDFRPKKKIEGKLSSSQEELVLQLERTPKIIADFRGHFGQESFLVGFKLLSGAPRDKLIEAALEQNVKNHLNLTVANDLRALANGQHPVILVTPEGGAINLAGDRNTVAENLVEFVRKRVDVHWYRTERAELPDIPREEKVKFARQVKFAQDSHLLYDTSGNMSMRLGDMLMVTPRQVDKSKVTPEDFVVALVDHGNSMVYYKSGVKSSIDTAVGDTIYRRYPDIKYLLHFHNPWGLSTRITSFPYPCGVKEEAQETLRHLGEVNPKEGFAIELLHHGYLIGLPEGGIEKLEKEWEESLREFKQHVINLNKGEDVEGFMKEGLLKPIFCDTNIIGVMREHPDGAIVYLSEKARGKGVGRRIIDQLIERQMQVQTVDECGALGFYGKFGFKGEKNPSNGIFIFRPPQIAKTDELFDRINEWRVK